MPVVVEVHKVPHFKGSVNGKVEPWRQDFAGTFSVQTSLLKIGHLLHKIGFVDSQLLPTVTLCNEIHIFLKCLFWSKLKSQFIRPACKKSDY